MDSVADSGTGGDAPPPITGASTDREDEDAGMGLLADGRRRREPQTITRPVPALIRAAQTTTSGTLTRPCLRSRPAGGGFKPPRAALAEDCCGERSRKRHPSRCQVGVGETSASESLLTCRNKATRHQNRGLAVGSRDEPGGCPPTGQAVSGMEAT